MDMRRQWGAVVGAVLVAAILGACSGAPDPTPSATQSVSPAPTADEVEESVSPSPIDSPAASSTPESASPGAIVYKHPGSGTDGLDVYLPEQDGPFAADDAAGSGCHPSSTTSLPDGIWRGIVKSHTAESMNFDLVCSYRFGSPAFTSANDANWEELFAQNPDLNGERPEGGDPLPYGIVNDSSRIRTLTIAPNADYWPLYAEAMVWEAARSQGASIDEIWVFVNNGVVTEVSEVYYP
jgi:hypothetical protein